MENEREIAKLTDLIDQGEALAEDIAKGRISHRKTLRMSAWAIPILIGFSGIDLAYLIRDGGWTWSLALALQLSVLGLWVYLRHQSKQRITWADDTLPRLKKEIWMLREIRHQVVVTGQFPEEAELATTLHNKVASQN